MNEGLIGIIASRLKDYFNKPSFVITNSNDLLKGSCRSTEDYNIGKIVKKLYLILTLLAAFLIVHLSLLESL